MSLKLSVTGLVFYLWVAAVCPVLAEVAASPQEELELRFVVDIQHRSTGRSRTIETAPRLKTRSGEKAEIVLSSAPGQEVRLKVNPSLTSEGLVDLDLEVTALLDSEVISRKVKLSTPPGRPVDIDFEDTATTVHLEAFVFNTGK